MKTFMQWMESLNEAGISKYRNPHTGQTGTDASAIYDQSTNTLYPYRRLHGIDRLDNYLNSKPNPIDWKYVSEFYVPIHKNIEFWKRQMDKLESSSDSTPRFTSEEAQDIYEIYALLTKLVNHVVPQSGGDINVKLWKVFSQAQRQLEDIKMRLDSWNQNAKFQYKPDFESSYGSALDRRYKDFENRGRISLPPPAKLPMGNQ